MTNETCRALADLLEKQHKAIMDCEDEALRALDSNDVDAYRTGMKRKAEMIADLYDAAQDTLASLPQPDIARVGEKLKRFSSGAKTALRLDSVFYMSALLYPDDHKKGEPDNLKRLISSL